MGLRIVEAVLLILFCSNYAEAQADNANIDCGGYSSIYGDFYSITWTSDNSIGGIYGEAKNVTPPPYVVHWGTQSPLSSIRFFPGGQSKYCYVFDERAGYNITKGEPYLIRASFWAGSELPYPTRFGNNVFFKLLIYGDEWENVSISLPQTDKEVNKEIYVMALKDNIEICLSGNSSNDSDIPFISSLVIRQLSNELDPIMYMAAVYERRWPFKTVKRMNYGVSSDHPVGSADIRSSGSKGSDEFDRIWEADTTPTLLQTQSPINSPSGTNNVPALVMQTARENNERFTLQFQLPPYSYGVIVIYFAEISPFVNASGQRDFSCTISTAVDHAQIFPLSQSFELLRTESIAHQIYLSSQDQLIFEFEKGATSIYGPLVNAIEIFQVFNRSLSNGAADEEASSVSELTTHFQSLASWTGDPCLPFPYNWLSCTQDTRPYIDTIYLENKNLSGDMPAILNSFKRLTVLSLSKNNLSGTIPDLSSLKKLKILDLHDNNLGGKIPPFLGNLPALERLDLSNNNFSGDIPQTLLAKAASKRLDFSYTNYSQILDTPSNKKSGIRGKVVIVVAVAVGVFVFLVILLIVVYMKAKKTSTTKAIDSSPRNVAEAFVGKIDDVQTLSFEEIKYITRNFENEIGRGGFGLVYEGRLRNGLEVAVKVLSETSTQGKKEFINEVQFLSRVHHTNLVKLVGYCYEPELVLVYEYMAYGSLSDSLHGERVPLSSWKERLRIASEAAEGLEYLHRGCNPSIIHRDIKSSNILLSANLTAKISDFGISKSKSLQDPRLRKTGSEISRLEDFEQSQSIGIFATGSLVQGTPGYLDPLYQQSQIADTSIDVYAFGVLLFELMTARRPIIQDVRDNRQTLHIVNWARPFLERNQLEEIMDSRMSKDLNLSSVWKVVDIALACVDINKNTRPTMREVKKELDLAIAMEIEDHSSYLGQSEMCGDYGYDFVQAR